MRCLCSAGQVRLPGKAKRRVLLMSVWDRQLRHPKHQSSFVKAVLSRAEVARARAEEPGTGQHELMF